MPGVSSDLREDACFCDQGNLDIAINGARRSSVNWLLDGASNVNTYNNFTLVTTPSLDAIQEITVITSTYQAEWARNGGGLVNVVTKAGTNRFSGSAYDFVRNDALNANYFFRNMAPQEQINSAPPRLRYNNFGFTVGGPALPNRKNMFFFFSGDWRRSTRATGTLGLRFPIPVGSATRRVRTTCRLKRAIRTPQNFLLFGRPQINPGPILTADPLRLRSIPTNSSCDSTQLPTPGGCLEVATCTTVWIHLVSTNARSGGRTSI